MNIVKLYHGTDKINLNYLSSGKSKKDNDFGEGLYFTSNLEQAKAWSIKRGKSKGAVYEIEIDLDNPLLNIKSYNEKEIKELLYYCRCENVDLANEFIEGFEKADIVYGRMLGSIPLFKKYVRQFHGENISVLHNSNNIKSINYNVKCDIVNFEDLEKKMEFIGTKGNDQYCFKSEKAEKIANKCITKIYYTEIQTIEEQNAKFSDYENIIKYEK